MFHLKALVLLLAVFTVILGATAEARGGYGVYGQGQARSHASYLSQGGYRAPASYNRYTSARSHHGHHGGHYEIVQKAAWIAGGTRSTWVPAHYETRYDSCGRAIRVLVRDGYWGQVSFPGHYERRPVRVWVGASWSFSGR